MKRRITQTVKAVKRITQNSIQGPSKMSIIAQTVSFIPWKPREPPMKSMFSSAEMIM